MRIRWFHLMPLFLAFAGCGGGDESRSEGLAIGSIAPDFAGVDMDGKALKLSDFRGKVVVLDFWATWCGPCRAMLPHERDLVKRLEGKPFALVGVNVDTPGPNVQSFFAKENITWANFKDGPGGPIAALYGVRSLPTIYVLDAEGVIR